MDKTVKHGRLKSTWVGHPGVGSGFPGVSVQNRADLVLQEPDVRLGARMSCPMARMSGPTIPDLNRDFQTRLWAEFDDFGGKIDGNSWMESGEIGDMLDPLETKQMHGSNSTKLRQTNKSQKKLEAIFGGDFRNLGRNQAKEG